MPNTFYPKKSLLVDASAPHPKNTQYKVSVGEEDWGGKTQTVIKVQLVYNGKVAGRKAPSYPYGSNDADRVAEAIEKIKSEYAAAPKVQIIPALPIKRLKKNYYVAALLKVPAGKVTRWEDIEAFLCRSLGYDRVKPDDDSSWPYFDRENNEIPYWRVVGSYGYLSGRSAQTERDELLLMQEGLEIESCGAGNKSRRVKDYKKHLFDFSTIDGSFLKNIEGFKSRLDVLMEKLRQTN